MSRPGQDDAIERLAISRYDLLNGNGSWVSASEAQRRAHREAVREMIEFAYPIIASSVLRTAATSLEPWEWALAGQHVDYELNRMADAYENSDGT